MHICLALKENHSFHYIFMGGKAVALHYLRARIHSDPSSLCIPNLVQILHSTLSLTISCLDNPIACCTVSLVQALLPSVHSFQHASRILFFPL